MMERNDTFKQKRITDMFTVVAKPTRQPSLQTVDEDVSIDAYNDSWENEDESSRKNVCM